MLPPLPKKRQHKEADITPDIIAWFVANYPRPCAVEVKRAGEHLKPHQLVALRQVASDSFSYKIPDTGRRNPFDFVVLKDCDAFVVHADGRQCQATNIKDGSVFSFHV